MFFNTIQMLNNNQYIELCLEGSSSLFNNLGQKEKESLIQHHSVTHFKKGEILFRDGENSHDLICLVKGKVKIYKVGVGGREQILRMVKPQEFIGYRALLSDTPFTASASALEDSTICSIEKEYIIRILKKNSDLSYKFMQVLAAELGSSNNRIASLTQKHIRGRLAESLIILRDTYGLENDGKTLNVYLSREDIAHLSNMTTSNAIRTLSTFASEELIALEGRKIIILDNNRLYKISELG